MVARACVELPWGTVSYLEWPGEPGARTVLLLHGAGVDSAELSWGALGSELAAAGHRVLAPDHPGYGASTPGPTTQQGLVDYVGRFVDALDLGSHVVAGLSLGGGLAIGHGLARPDAVRGAVLLGSYGLMPRLSDGPFSVVRQVFTWALVRTGLLAVLSQAMVHSNAALDASLAALIRDPAQRTPELLAQVRAAARAGHGLDTFARWQRSEVRWDRLASDYRDRLPGFRPPALIVHGDQDSSVPIARAVAAQALIPGARLRIVTGAGHWVQRDQPAAVLAAMREFMASV